MQIPDLSINDVFVAPFMGAWIEINFGDYTKRLTRVAPFMGAWIEITLSAGTQITQSSRSLYGGVD